MCGRWVGGVVWRSGRGGWEGWGRVVVIGGVVYIIVLVCLHSLCSSARAFCDRLLASILLVYFILFCWLVLTRAWSIRRLYMLRSPCACNISHNIVLVSVYVFRAVVRPFMRLCARLGATRDLNANYLRPFLRLCARPRPKCKLPANYPFPTRFLPVSSPRLVGAYISQFFEDWAGRCATSPGRLY